MATSVAKAEDSERFLVKIRAETWRRLSARKDPGETFDEVIVSLLNDADEARAEDAR